MTAADPTPTDPKPADLPWSTPFYRLSEDARFRFASLGLTLDERRLLHAMIFVGERIEETIRVPHDHCLFGYEETCVLLRRLMGLGTVRDNARLGAAAEGLGQLGLLEEAAFREGGQVLSWSFVHPLWKELQARDRYGRFDIRDLRRQRSRRLIALAEEVGLVLARERPRLELCPEMEPGAQRGRRSPGQATWGRQGPQTLAALQRIAAAKGIALIAVVEGLARASGLVLRIAAPHTRWQPAAFAAGARRARAVHLVTPEGQRRLAPADAPAAAQALLARLQRPQESHPPAFSPEATRLLLGAPHRAGPARPERQGRSFSR